MHDATVATRNAVRSKSQSRGAPKPAVQNGNADGSFSLGNGPDTRSKSQMVGQRSKIKKDGFFLHKVVVITGASSGIGRGLAYWYLNNGARVALIGRDIRELDRIAKSFPSQSLAIQAELNDD